MDECDLSGVCEVCKVKCIEKNNNLQAKLNNIELGVKRLNNFLVENRSLDGGNLESLPLGCILLSDKYQNEIHIAESLADLIDWAATGGL